MPVVIQGLASAPHEPALKRLARRLSSITAPSPSPPPAPPLASLTELSCIGATMSSAWSSKYRADKVIDGDVTSISATGAMQVGGNAWISVQVPPGSRIGYVAVYNRDDNAWMAAMLSPYEVWLSAIPAAAAGRSSAAHLCGADLQAPGLGPFMTWCGGRDDLPYVTVVIREAARTGFRILALGEIKVYAAPDAPHPPPPSPLVPPLPPPPSPPPPPPKQPPPTPAVPDNTPTPPSLPPSLPPMPSPPPPLRRQVLSAAESVDPNPRIMKPGER